MPVETLRHITRIPAFEPATPVEPDLGGVLKPPSFLQETEIIFKAEVVIAPPAVAVLQPTIDQQAKNALSKTVSRTKIAEARSEVRPLRDTLVRSKEDYSRTSRRRSRGRRSGRCARCNSRHSSSGGQCKSRIL